VRFCINACECVLRYAWMRQVYTINARIISFFLVSEREKLYPSSPRYNHKTRSGLLSRLEFFLGSAEALIAALYAAKMHGPTPTALGSPLQSLHLQQSSCNRLVKWTALRNQLWSARESRYSGPRGREALPLLLFAFIHACDFS